MTASPSPKPTQPIQPGPFHLLALHLTISFLTAIAMAGGDMLTNLYHEGHQLDFPHQFIPPALAMGVLGFVATLALGPIVLQVVRIRASEAWPARISIALTLSALFAGLQWAEATPAFYTELSRNLTGPNLAVAALGHLVLTLRRPAHAASRGWLVGSTALCYLAGMLNLAAWFYMGYAELLLGTQGADLFSRFVQVFGSIVLASGLLLIAPLLAGARSPGPRTSAAFRILVAPLPYIIVALAASLWLREYGDSRRITPTLRTCLRLLPLLAAAAILSAVAFRGLRSLLVPALLSIGMLAVSSLYLFQHDLLGAFGLGDARRDPAAPRHIILLTVDTLRTDALEPYGGTEIETPSLRSLAADSLVFEQPVSAAPWTLPSFASILTGLAPGVFGHIEPISKIGTQVETLAERLTAAGFLTGAVGSNPFLRPRHGLDQGFQTHEFYPADRRAKTLGARVIDTLDPEFFRTDPDSEQLARRGIRWLERHASRDFFFWFHFYDPHAPWGPPAPFRPRGAPSPGIREPWDRTQAVRSGEDSLSEEQKLWIRALYYQEVRYVDYCIGLITGALRKLGIYEDALIVFTSDHGEEFWDHGRLEHGHTLYQELIHVPLMIKMPGQSRMGRITQPVSTVSIAPTILEMSGVAFDPEFMSAPSLVPLIKDTGTTFSASPLFSENTFQIDRIHGSSVRVGDLKLITGVDEIGEELYDLHSDPEELADLTSTREADVGEGVRKLQEYRERNAVLRSSHGIESLGESDLPPEAIERLRDLGYLQ